VNFETIDSFVLTAPCVNLNYIDNVLTSQGNFISPLKCRIDSPEPGSGIDPQAGKQSLKMSRSPLVRTFLRYVAPSPRLRPQP